MTTELDEDELNEKKPIKEYKASYENDPKYDEAVKQAVNEIFSKTGVKLSKNDPIFFIPFINKVYLNEYLFWFKESFTTTISKLNNETSENINKIKNEHIKSIETLHNSIDRRLDNITGDIARLYGEVKENITSTTRENLAEIEKHIVKTFEISTSNSLKKINSNFSKDNQPTTKKVKTSNKSLMLLGAALFLLAVSIVFGLYSYLNYKTEKATLDDILIKISKADKKFNNPKISKFILTKG